MVKRVILTTGGTGGHVFPALAVAEELLLLQDMRVLFIGSNYGPEKDLVTKAGLEFIGLPVRGFIGRGTQAIGAGFNMLKSIAMAIKILRNFKPDLVLGFGGYAAFAPIISAQILGINTAIHEQNAIAGVSNKVQGFRARKIFLSLPNTQGFDLKKCIVTGNPVRAVMANIANNNHDFSGKRLLVVGGSQGAKALNNMIIENFDLCNDANITVRHQSGERDFERVHKAYVEGKQPTDMLSAFIDDMAKAYDWADLVLCRSGASTVAELAAVGRGAVLIPFPYATHDHQTHNAKLLVNNGAAKLYAEKNIVSQNVMKNVMELLQDKQSLQNMAHAATKVNMGNAAKNIVQNIMNNF